MPRSVDASTVFSVDSESTCPPGMTLTDSMFVPCSPVVVPLPEAAEPLIRSQIGTIDRVLARSGVWTKFESGTLDAGHVLVLEHE